MTGDEKCFCGTSFFPSKNECFYQKLSYQIHHENQEKTTPKHNILNLSNMTFLEWTQSWICKSYFPDEDIRSEVLVLGIIAE